MTTDHDRHPKRVSEAAPVQVFFGRTDRARLDRLTAQLDTSKSDVLRRSLAALEQQLLDPAAHPALRLVGLVDADDGSDDGRDLAVHHDAALAAAHDRPPPARRRRRGKS
ncbi:MAG TPA: hypothetical protein VHV78_07625 [Gemmatimonadaceae bacterium]|jgi:hypothetical protein|nr:hypothetical protein [Gemmatimonadaceae bacterium]